MNPLLASGSTAAAAPGTVTTNPMGLLSPTEWTDALAGAAAPQGRPPVAPSASNAMDDSVHDFSVADAVARATAQFAVATPAAAKAGAAASASTGAQAETVSDDTGVAQSALFQHQALTSIVTGTAASSSLGATGRSPAAATRPRSPSVSETAANAAPGSDVSPQSPVQTEEPADRSVDAGETSSGDVPQESAQVAATSQPAGTTGRRSIRAAIRQPAADRAAVSSPAAAAVTAAVPATQPLQTSVSRPAGLPSVSVTAVASAPGSVTIAAQSPARSGLTGSAPELPEAGLTGGVIAPSSAALQTRTSDATTDANAADLRGQAARADAGDPAATMAVPQPTGAPASTSRLLPINRPGSPAQGSQTAQATTSEPLARVAALSSAPPATAATAEPGSAILSKAGESATGVSRRDPLSGTAARIVPATATAPAPAAGAETATITTAATGPGATVILTHAAPAHAAHAENEAQATSVAAAVALNSPLQTPPDESLDTGRGTGSPTTSTNVIPAAAATTAATTAPNAPLSLNVVAVPAAAAGIDASATDRASDAAPRPSSLARYAPVAAATTTPVPGGTTNALASTPSTKPVTMTVTQGGALSLGTPASASGLVTGSSTGSLSPAAANAAGATVSGPGGVGPTTAPTAAATPLGYTAATPDAMAASVVAMYRSGQSSLVLRLDPPGLGTVSVHVALGGNADVNVLFVPAVAQTAHLLQTGLGDLRQAMAASGLTLGQATIGSGAGGGAGGGTSGNPGSNSGATSRLAVAVATPSEPAPPEHATRGARAIA